jgi:RNA polymerase sigma-70 factor (ECF subfamily)
LFESLTISAVHANGVFDDRLLREVTAVPPLARLLEQVWPETAPRLAKLAIGLGLKADQAADVLQDVYLTAIERPPEIASREDTIRWLFRVTANRCHLEHRRRGRWRRLWSSLTGGWNADSACQSALLVGELKKDVEQALATLLDDDRTLVVMRYFSNLNSREISEIVGLPETTVRTRLRAARLKLAAELADWSDANE